MLNQKIEKLLIEYLSETTNRVLKMAEEGRGRKILGEVINRPDDIDIEIDKVGEEILDNLLRKNQIAATIFSEPEARDIKNGNHLYGAIDPFDGSILFLRGFEQNWYTALTFFDKKHQAICAGIADILNKKFYISNNQGVYLLDLNKNQKKTISRSKRIKNLKEPIVLASYIMSSQYSRKFLDIFSDLIKKLHPKAIFYPQGGSFIYAFLASGLVDAYIMFDEPRSEIDPGFALAKKAGCEVVSVDSDGRFEDYAFLPGRQHDKVNLLIVAATPQLRDELINYYVKKYAQRYSFGRV